MNKPVIVSLLAFLTAISGVTYYTLQDKTAQLRGAHNVSTSEVYQQWLWWLQTYGKQYQHEEVPLKFNTFKDNYVQIQKFNAAKMYKFTLGVNQFADLSNAEFQAMQKQGLVKKTFFQEPKKFDTASIPASVDWRKKGAVTPVKNQGQCGSCWSFSATGALEGLNYITNKKLLSFSEQQICDCSTSYGNKGCQGGLMDYAFKYTEKAGCETESEYPYKGADESCEYVAADEKFKNTGYHDVTANNSAQLKAALAQQPVSVAIQANGMSFQFYTSGVFDDKSCGTQLDHGVLAVGYGTESGQAYYIVKNSWGATWGDQGYIKIAIEDGPGICGIQMQPSYPTV